MTNKRCDNCDCIKSNEYGKLWVETEDFFTCPKIKEQSKFVKNIRN